MLIDVREDNEWAQGHLPGALHLGKGIIERDIEQRVPQTDAKLVLYCGGGFRSRARRGKPPENGLHQRRIDGWRLERLARCGPPTEKAEFFQFRMFNIAFCRLHGALN